MASGLATPGQVAVATRIASAPKVAGAAVCPEHTSSNNAWKFSSPTKAGGSLNFVFSCPGGCRRVAIPASTSILCCSSSGVQVGVSQCYTQSTAELHKRNECKPC